MRFSSRCAVGALGILLLTLPARAADADKYLPSDANLVASVNVQQILKSNVFEKYALKTIEAALKGNDDVQKILKEIGLDPLKDFSRLTIASGAEAGPDKPLIIAHGKFDAKKIEAKVAEEAKKNDKLKLTQKNGKTILETAAGDQGKMYATVADETTVLIAATEEILTTALAAGGSNKKPTLAKGMQDLLSVADDKQSIWLAILPSVTDKIPLPDPNAKKLLEKLAGVGGTVNVADDLQVEIKLMAKDADGAKELAGQIEQGLEQAKSLLPVFVGNQEEFKPVIELVGSMKSSTNDKTISIKGGLSADYIKKALDKK